MSVLLINTSCVRPNVSPIGLEYVCSSLAQHHIDFRVIDLNFEPERDIEQHLQRADLELVGLNLRNIDTAYLLRNEYFLPHLRQLVHRVKQERDVPVVLGGAGFSVMPQEIMEFTAADFGVVGYGEEALPLLVDALRTGAEVSDIPNLAWRREGRIHFSPRIKLGYGDVPRRRRDILRNKEYFRRCGMGNIETKRGCFMHCGYCNEPNIVGRRVEMRGFAHVVDEFQQLKAQGVHHVHVCDSEFNVGKQARLIRLCEEIAGHDPGVTWTCFMHPNGKLVPEALLRAMKAAGCTEVTLAVDSGSDDLLRSMDKLHTRDDVMVASERVRKAGIRLVHSYLIGWPGESLDTLRETVDLVRKSRPDIALVFAGIRVYPRTKIEQLAREDGLIVDGTDLLVPCFYRSQEVIDEFMPYLRSQTRGLPGVLLPTRGIGFLNMLMQNIYLDGFSGSFSEFVEHVESLSTWTKARKVGQTSVDWIRKRRRRASRVR